jgi:hypothetical protein
MNCCTVCVSDDHWDVAYLGIWTRRRTLEVTACRRAADASKKGLRLRQARSAIMTVSKATLPA